MAILKNVALFYVKCNPKRPNKRLNPDNPTWEVQLRTTNKDQKKEWDALGLKTHAVRTDPEDEESKIAYWRTNLRKRSIKAENGEKAGPVEVKDGKLRDLNPDTIGNGSIGNVRLFQYPYKKGDGTASVLMGIQVTKLIKYEPKERDDDFEETDMEVVEPEPGEEDEVVEMPDNDDDAPVEEKTTPSAPKKVATQGF
jgi:hypothetical protein